MGAGVDCRRRKLIETRRLTPRPLFPAMGSYLFATVRGSPQCVDDIVSQCGGQMREQHRLRAFMSNPPIELFENHVGHKVFDRQAHAANGCISSTQTKFRKYPAAKGRQAY